MKKLLLRLLPGGILILLWQCICAGEPKREFLFGSPELVFTVAAEEIPSQAFWVNAGVTTFEALLGLFVGTICGTACGLLLWTNVLLSSIVRPYLAFFGAIPVFAIAPMFIIWFGTGVASKCMMAACGVFFLAMLQSYEGAQSCSERQTLYLRSLGVSRFVVIRKIILPGTLRWTLAGLKLNIGVALMGAFIGEFVSSESGLGHYILKAGSLYDMPRVLLGVFVFSGIALLLHTGVGMLSRHVRI